MDSFWFCFVPNFLATCFRSVSTVACRLRMHQRNVRLASLDRNFVAKQGLFCFVLFCFFNGSIRLRRMECHHGAYCCPADMGSCLLTDTISGRLDELACIDGHKQICCQNSRGSTVCQGATPECWCVPVVEVSFLWCCTSFG